MGSFAHHLEDVVPLLGHVVDVCVVVQRHLQAVGMVLGGVHAVKQHTCEGKKNKGNHFGYKSEKPSSKAS